jgi:hypothetical protein
MNLKEAFRFQNQLQRLMDEAQYILSSDKAVTTVEATALRHKVCSDAEDETTLETPDTEYADQITQVAGLLMYLLDEKAKLGAAIRAAKQTLDMDFDGEVSLNIKRQQLAKLFSHMSQIRSTEVLYPNAGVGYKFNAEGNQVTYRCDLKKVTTINFDRNKIRSYGALLNRRSDSVSADLDRCLVNTEVDYAPAFDVNDSFREVLEAFCNAAA